MTWFGLHFCCEVIAPKHKDDRFINSRHSGVRLTIDHRRAQSRHRSRTEERRTRFLDSYIDISIRMITTQGSRRTTMFATEPGRRMPQKLIASSQTRHVAPLAKYESPAGGCACRDSPDGTEELKVQTTVWLWLGCVAGAVRWSYPEKWKQQDMADRIAAFATDFNTIFASMRFDRDFAMRISMSVAPPGTFQVINIFWRSATILLVLFALLPGTLAGPVDLEVHNPTDITQWQTWLFELLYPLGTLVVTFWEAYYLWRLHRGGRRAPDDFRSCGALATASSIFFLFTAGEDSEITGQSLFFTACGFAASLNFLFSLWIQLAQWPSVQGTFAWGCGLGDALIMLIITLARGAADSHISAKTAYTVALRAGFGTANAFTYLWFILLRNTFGHGSTSQPEDES